MSETMACNEMDCHMDKQARPQSATLCHFWARPWDSLGSKRLLHFALSQAEQQLVETRS